MITMDTVILIIQYDFKFQEDSTDKYSVRNEIMTLLVGEKHSHFVSKNNLEIDSIINTFRSAQEFNDFMMNPTNTAFPKVLYQIYKDFSAKEITHIETIAPDVFRYKEPLELFKWDITGDSKKWQQHNLQKATAEFGGRKWIAWFAPEIPISDGPYKFNGLPGLIVSVADSKGHYVFNVISIESPKYERYIEMSTGIRYIDTDKKGFIRAYNHFKMDILERAKSVQLNNPEVLMRIADNVKRNNNPIELIFD